ncbi:MAG: hypothetical protein GY866_34185, partial [Proteobacteria bacterium]|nr:hypothetical protein [Pseudomonadota bacterium]
MDLIIKFEGREYAVEVKSYTNERGYNHALLQAARYGEQLKLLEIPLV